MSSKTVIAASGFTYVFGCRLPLRWLSRPQKETMQAAQSALVSIITLVGFWTAGQCPQSNGHLFNNPMRVSVNEDQRPGPYNDACWMFVYLTL